MAGTANFANALSTARNFSITGSDGTARAQSFDGTGDIGLPFALSTTGVSVLTVQATMLPKLQ